MPDWTYKPGFEPGKKKKRPVVAAPSSGNSGWFPDFLSNNPVSEAVGHAQDVGSRWTWKNPASEAVGHAQDYASNAIHGSAYTAAPVTFFTGPHQLVDFATHDWIAGLVALGKVGYEQKAQDIRHGPKGFLLGPLGYESPRTFLHDPHTLLGGVVTPTVEGYNKKYQIERSAKALATGDYGDWLSAQGQAGRNEARDPFGTLLDLSVAGKTLGAAHLAYLERASAAGKLAEGSVRARIAGRVLDEHPREFWVQPGKDALGNPYEGAKGKLITKSYRAQTTQGRLLQSYMDEVRLHIPEHIPFSAHRLSRAETMRQVQQVFQRHIYHIQLFADKVNKLPEGLRYAVQFVAELPRDLRTVGPDPLGYALDLYKQERDKLAATKPAADEAHIHEMRLEAVTHKVEVLEEINKHKDAIYDPANPLHDQFKEAYDAGYEANRRVEAELTRRGLVKQDKLDAQSVLPHRLLRDVRYTPYGQSEDTLGSYHAPGGAPLPEPPTIHRYELGGGGAFSNRNSVLIDKRTGEVHIADGVDHATLAEHLGISPDDLMEHYYQSDIREAVPAYDIPRHWQLPFDVSRHEVDAMVAKLQSIENLPVAVGQTGDATARGLIPARVEQRFGTTTEEALAIQQAALDSHAGVVPEAGPGAVIHRHPLPPDPLHPDRVAALIDTKTGEIHLASPTGPAAVGSAPSAAWHADLAQAAGLPIADFTKPEYIQATVLDALPGYDIPRRWTLPAETPADKLDKIVSDLQQIENLPVDRGGFEEMIPARAASDALHNPLAQYGESWSWPHEPFAVVGAPVGLGGRILDWAQKGAPRSRALERYAEGKRQRPGDAWLEGIINSHPEAFNTGTFRRWSQVRSRDYVDRFLYPMSGRLESGPNYAEQGGKLGDESYILKPRQYTEKPLVGTEVTFRTLKDLTDAHSDLHQRTSGKLAETPQEWINRLDKHGLRRIKTKEVDKWAKEIDLSRNLFHKIFHGGLNQVWRYMLLAVKPAWAAANYYTNQALELLKNTGRGGMRAFINGAYQANKRNVYKLYQYTKRMKLSAQTRYEVNQLLQEKMGPSMGEALHEIDPAIGAAEYNRGGLFNPNPRGARAVPADALTPQGGFFEKLAKHPGYSARRAAHILGSPARLVERMNRSGESFVRGQAYTAKVYQVTGKMAHTGEEMKKILREAKISGREEKMQELLMGRNGPMDVLGDYSRMGPKEREFVTTLVPFYAWYKTILGISAKFFVRDVERVWVLHTLANALSETATQDMQLGIPVPSFAKDLIPLFGAKGDTQLTVGSRTWNPFQTPVDLARVAAAVATRNPDTATPNETGLGLFSPLVQGGYTFFSGKDPFYGGNYRGWGSGQGAVGQTVGSFFYSTPEERLWTQLHGDYKSKVYAAPPGDSPVPGVSNEAWVGLLQYLGLPAKYVNLPALETRAIEEGARPPTTPPPRRRRRRARQTSGQWNWK